LLINNLIELGSSPDSCYSGLENTVRNNAYNLNGNSMVISESDFGVTTAIDSNGIPVSKIEHAEVITDDETTNNIGLATAYVIPTAITYQNQGATWQNGAVILP